MFGCSKIKYVKPSLVTYHLSSVTCLILQPWLGLGTWFFWQCVLKRSTCGADRHVIAWLVFLLLFSTDFFSLQHWYFLSPSIWFIEVWDERSWATFWTASSGAMCISHLMWLGIALHVHCHRLFIWCALMCIHCHRLFPDSSKVRGFARNNPAKSVKRGGQILDGEVQIFFYLTCVAWSSFCVPWSSFCYSNYSCRFKTCWWSRRRSLRARSMWWSARSSWSTTTRWRGWSSSWRATLPAWELHVFV